MLITSLLLSMLDEPDIGLCSASTIRRAQTESRGEAGQLDPLSRSGRCQPIGPLIVDHSTQRITVRHRLLTRALPRTPALRRPLGGIARVTPAELAVEPVWDTGSLRRSCRHPLAPQHPMNAIRSQPPTLSKRLRRNLCPPAAPRTLLSETSLAGHDAFLVLLTESFLMPLVRERNEIQITSRTTTTPAIQ